MNAKSNGSVANTDMLRGIILPTDNRDCDHFYLVRMTERKQKSGQIR